MILAKSAPFVSAFIDAVDEAIRQANPGSGISAIQRTWLAFCVTATLVTHSICWARFERASLGIYSMAALSWMFRHSKLPWDQLLVASVRVILRHHGITSGSLVIDDTDNPRSKSAKKLAYLYKLRDKESGGYVWGQRSSMNKAVSLALLAGGILLIIFGASAGGSFSSDISRFFTGSPTDKAIWMLIGGVVLSIIGVVGLLCG